MNWTVAARISLQVCAVHWIDILLTAVFVNLTFFNVIFYLCIVSIFFNCVLWVLVFDLTFVWLWKNEKIKYFASSHYLSLLKLQNEQCDGCTRMCPYSSALLLPCFWSRFMDYKSTEVIIFLVQRKQIMLMSCYS